MSNGKLAIVWSCALLIGLVGILTASFFFFNRSSTEVNTETESTQGDKLKAFSALQADAKSLLGLAQVLSLFGVTLQVCPPGPRVTIPTRQRPRPCTGMPWVCARLITEAVYTHDVCALGRFPSRPPFASCRAYLAFYRWTSWRP